MVHACPVGDIKTSARRCANGGSKQVGKFVLDDFHCFQNFVFVTGSGDDHLA